MNEAEVIPWSVEIVAEYGLVGLVVGVAYFLARRMNQNLLQSTDQRWMMWTMEGLRILVAIAFFAWLASLGTVPVLSAFVGFLIGRVAADKVMGDPG
ncbi:MAG: hypothetical protein HC826_01525 [Rhodospirillales bacterium]|nr:hypothetical protein [Rhodospirillales bacterium]